MTIRPYEGYDRVDLTQGMRNKDKPKGPDDYWWAGDQMKALEYYAPEEFKLIGYTIEEDYQGDIWAIAEWTGKDHRWVLINDGFGSCSGCDALEGGQDGYGYVEDVLRENTVQFLSVSDMRKYIEESDKIPDRERWDAKAELLKIIDEKIPMPDNQDLFHNIRYFTMGEVSMMFDLAMRGVANIRFEERIPADLRESMDDDIRLIIKMLVNIKSNTLNTMNRGKE